MIPLDSTEKQAKINRLQSTEDLHSQNGLVYGGDAVTYWEFVSNKRKSTTVKVSGNLCINSGKAIRHAAVKGAGIALYLNG